MEPPVGSEWRARSSYSRPPSRRGASRWLVSGSWLAACLLVGLPEAGAAQTGVPDSIAYRVDRASRLEVRTGKAGLFGFAGHNHRIRAQALSGVVVYVPAEPSRSRVSVTVAAESLEVLTPPDTAERRKVAEAMRREVLETERYPEISLVSRTLTPTADGFHLVAALTLKGTTREIPIDVKVGFHSDSLSATCTFSVKQSDFGISPYRGGPAGTVKVADRVVFDIALVGVKEEGHPAR
jgi:polyisoprenoid-binding protein YceI